MIKFARLTILLFSLVATAITLLAALLPGDATPPNPWIAFESNRDGNNEIYRMRPDGSQQQRLTNDPGYDTNPQWSPDGQWIIFESYGDRKGEIYRMRANGTERQNLTNNPGNDTNPQWSPDGQWIAFELERDGSYRFYRMRANGTEQQRLTTNPGYHTNPHWSPPIHRSWHPWRLLGLCGVMLAISLVPEKLTRWRER
jgi:TolB protein